MNGGICYSEKPGKSNTENIVLASTTGRTALLAADYSHDLEIKIIAVGVNTFGWKKSEEIKKRISNKRNTGGAVRSLFRAGRGRRIAVFFPRHESRI